MDGLVHVPVRGFPWAFFLALFVFWFRVFVVPWQVCNGKAGKSWVNL